MIELTPEKRLAGVLTPVFALRGANDLGIGDTAALIEFGRWAAELGLSVLQVLPANETGGDNSPYNIISSMAMDPLTIAATPDAIPELTASDFQKIVAQHDLEELRKGPVDYPAVRALKRELLMAAYRKFADRPTKRREADFLEFHAAHRGWLDPYAFYRALVALHNESEILTAWPEEQRTLATARGWYRDLGEDEQAEIDDLASFFRYVQWIAFEQWRNVREELGRLGVCMIGDVPVGVSIHSCDVWSEPHAFDLTRSSGAPPERTFQSDAFVRQWGQNWGFPLYDWEAMSHDNFAWWRRRLRAMREMFDLIRIDHALGFFRIYSFPWRPEENAAFVDLTADEAMERTGGRLPGFVPRDDDTPDHEAMNRRHGEVLLRIMIEEVGPHRLIAEDLGSVPDYVRPALEQLEIPGFKIPQWERNPDGSWIDGAKYSRLSLATFATHDHPPVHTMWNQLYEETQGSSKESAASAQAEISQLMEFAGRPDLANPRPWGPEIHRATMHALMASNSWLAIPLITDILGTEDRFNVPGAAGAENWTARLPFPTSELSERYQSEIEDLRTILKETNRLHNSSGPME